MTKCEFTYPRYFDLIFHVMAYFKVDNASDLYDEKYIFKMAEEKAGFEYDIIPVVNSLQNYYNENYERLMLINFLPYYCNDYNDYEEMKNNFLTCRRFTQDDIKYFIKPFIEMLDNESVFFFEYWDKIDENYKLSKRSAEDYFRKELEKYSSVFDYFGKPCKILFSYIITRNGRGFYSDSHFAALIRFPENEAGFNFSFIQLLHEYTHNFTDGLLNKNINMKDGSHNLSENVVIVADYHLIKSVDEKFIPVYFEWIKNGRKEDLDEEKFLSIFSIDENVKAEMMKLINNIIGEIKKYKGTT